MKKYTILFIYLLFNLYTVQAAIITVSNLNDNGAGSLRQAITDAVNGDVININSAGAITISSELPIITATITINGNSGGTIISGNSTCRIFTVQVSTGTVTLNNLSIVNAWSGNGAAAGLYAITGNNGKVVLTNCSFVNCNTANSEAYGGAIATSADMDITNCTFSANSASLSGGALATLSACTVNITNCTIYKNTTNNAAGTGGLDITASAVVNIQSTILAGNTAGGTATAQNALTSNGGVINSLGNNLSNTAPFANAADLVNKNLTAEVKLSDIALTNGIFICTLNGGSIAINAANANAPATDQRGYGRVGAADIGSFENQPPVSTWNGTAWDLGTPWKYTDAVIDGTYNGVGFTCKNFTVNAAKAFTLSSGTLTVFGDLTLKSDATGTGSLINNGTISVTGATYAQSYLTGNKWHIVSPVASGGNISTFIQATGNAIPINGSNYGMMDYNETSNSWNSYFTIANIGANTLTSGKGYSVRRSSDGAITYTGALNYGIKTVPLTKLGTAWNCVGNPFPSAINMNNAANATANFLLTNSSSLDPSYACIYIWDDVAGQYKILGNVSFGARDLGQNMLQAGQGFFVKAATSSSSIQFTPAMQAHQTAMILKSAAISWPVIRLNVSNKTDSTSTIVAFNNAMTKGLDPTYDAGLLRGTKGISLYSRLVNDNGVDFAIQCLPETYDNLIIPIGIDNKAAGSLIFSAETIELPADCKVILEDKTTGTFTSLANGATFSTSVDAETSGTGRFFLHTSSTAINNNNGATGLNDAASSESLKVYAVRKTIYISGSNLNGGNAKVFDLNGKNYGIYKFTSDNIEPLDENALPAGMYMVHITSSEGKEKTFKVVLQ
ncbi:MAG: choice-of-anchor Q domain-containing protein [Bacteroidota bacterium]|nr:choice-of-anchor Q domain-containing protein [Bacteroidota bacterium]